MPTFDYLSHHDWLIYDETQNPDAQLKDTSMALQDSFIRFLPTQNIALNTAASATPESSSLLEKAPAALVEQDAAKVLAEGASAQVSAEAVKSEACSEQATAAKAAGLGGLGTAETAKNEAAGVPKANGHLLNKSLIEERATKPKALLHFYPSVRNTILLGAKDKLLTNFSVGVDYLVDQGYTVTLRPHGGLAVVNDAGVLNLALVSDNNHYPLTIDEAYQQMVRLIDLTLARYNLQVEAYEIADSYCPGKFDLVVGGRKIGGIAQRRFKSGLTTAAYISVSGDQKARAELIRDFYEVAQADERFPTVNPPSMISLTDLLPEGQAERLTVSRFKEDLLATIAEFSTYQAGDYLNPELQAIYQPRLEQAVKRSLSIQNPPKNNR